VEEYVCITVLSKPGEPQEAFSGRLSALWTGMLRSSKDDFEKVYAETTEFEEHGNRRSRQYLVEEGVIEVVERAFKVAGMDYQPIDREEVFSKFEAVAPEWMQIEH
jgi:hypothetical protein